MSPSHSAGRSVGSREGEHRRGGSPPQITAAEAATTRTAALPGMGVLASKTSAEARSATSAAQPMALRTAGRHGTAGANASRAPAPNSQARAVVTKYAQDGAWAVIHSE